MRSRCARWRTWRRRLLSWAVDCWPAKRRLAGVSLLLGESLNGFEGKTVLRNIQTKSGNRIPAGVAVVACGAEPNLELVRNTPLSGPHGSPVSDYLETEEKGIFAIGDLAFY